MSQHTSQPGRRRRTGQGSRPPVHALERTLQETTVKPLEISLGHTPPQDGGSGVEPIPLPLLEPRLQKRYLIMVRSHVRTAPALAAGVASLPGSASAFAATQATWRFLANERATLPVLVEPLREQARRQVAALKSRFAILVHDW